MTDQGLAQGMLDAIGASTAPPTDLPSKDLNQPPKPNQVANAVADIVSEAIPASASAPTPIKPPPVPRPRADVAKAEADARKAEALARKEELKQAGRQTRLGKLVGSGEIVKIYRREGGERAKVGNFTERDLDGYADIEDFIWEHIKPTWGFGTYEITYIGPSGTPREGPEIRLAAPMSGASGGTVPAPSQSAGLGLRDLRQAERDGEERYKKLIEEVKRGGGSDALAATMVETMRAQQEQMMRMMQDQMVRKSTERPPMPPPPPPDTTAAEAIKALSSIVSQITSQPAKTDDGYTRILEFIREDRERDRDHRASEEKERERREAERLRREDEREKARESLEKARLDFEMKQREEDRKHQIEMAKLAKTGDALSPLEQAAKAMEAVDKLRGNTGATGMDVLSMFVENLDSIAEKVGGAIASGRAAATTTAKKEGTATEAADKKKVTFPAAIEPLIDDMRRGARDKDPGIMVQAALKTIGRLAEDARWSRAAKSLLIRAGQGNKEATLSELDAFLTKLIEAEAPFRLEIEVAKSVMEALEQNWEMIMEIAASSMAQAKANA
jgi:hypothetical protein